MRENQKLVFLKEHVRESKSILGTKPAYYSYVLHESHCAESLIGYRNERNEWNAKWPNSCEVCDGAGATFYEENMAPLGSGRWWPMSSSDPCLCVAPVEWTEMVCPRCGEKIYDAILKACKPSELRKWQTDLCESDEVVNSWFESMGKCPLCGWNHGQNIDDFIAEGPECGCWYGLPHLYPSKLQKFVHRLFGDRSQRQWEVPIVTMPRRT